jgi:hypothetical protein
MILKEICEFIENHTSFILGTDLIYGHRETETQRHCVLVAERNVGEADFYLPDKATKIITVVTRSESYDEASNDSDIVFRALHGSSGWDLPVINSGILYHAQIIQSVGLSVYLGQDESGLHEFSCNYEFKIQQI